MLLHVLTFDAVTFQSLRRERAAIEAEQDSDILPFDARMAQLTDDVAVLLLGIIFVLTVPAHIYRWLRVRLTSALRQTEKV